MVMDSVKLMNSETEQDNQVSIAVLNYLTYPLKQLYTK
jgi:hypothetical protein